MQITCKLLSSASCALFEHKKRIIQREQWQSHGYFHDSKGIRKARPVAASSTFWKAATWTSKLKWPHQQFLCSASQSVFVFPALEAFQQINPRILCWEMQSAQLQVAASTRKGEFLALRIHLQIPVVYFIILVSWKWAWPKCFDMNLSLLNFPSWQMCLKMDIFSRLIEKQRLASGSNTAWESTSRGENKRSMISQIQSLPNYNSIKWLDRLGRVFMIIFDIRRFKISCQSEWKKSYNVLQGGEEFFLKKQGQIGSNRFRWWSRANLERQRVCRCASRAVSGRFLCFSLAG